MITATLTTQQAEHLAGLVRDIQRAQQVASDALALLTLGHVPADAVLRDINTDTGVLTFSLPEHIDASR